MKLAILGVKEKTDSGYNYYSFQKNMAGENLQAKSRQLIKNRWVNVKRISVFPTANFSFIDFGRKDYALNTNNTCILLVDTELDEKDVKGISIGSSETTRFGKQKVKLIKEVTDPYDLDFLTDIYFKYATPDNRSNATYDLLTWDFMYYCSNSNKESFKKLIADYTFNNASEIKQYGIDFSISDKNFILWKWLVDYKDILAKEESYQVKFGMYGEFKISNKSIKNLVKEKDISFKYIKALPHKYFLQAIKMLPKEYTRNLSKEDKVFLYFSLYSDEQEAVSLVEKGQVDINDLFKTAWNTGELINKDRETILKDRDYKPEEETCYDDDYDYAWDNEFFTEYTVVIDDQYDIVQEKFSWKDYLDRDLLEKISKRYAPRVKDMLLNKGWENYED
ncbi:hypothetical protein SAC12B_0004 [Lactobacillus phage SAC12B]|uniref:Uncharacterized protein n=1 Tax=Lactobacillus phage SAC12B TaxID=2510941 RepID=A0A4Y5FFA3_9CAUD|nr:hypothetical protein HWC10_gp004 [Lactobacillus phage SAC12B]QBJ03793.1 hypothetical protein SAC12B_0004 [Lactobacillus phage SAC12B]